VPIAGISKAAVGREELAICNKLNTAVSSCGGVSESACSKGSVVAAVAAFGSKTGVGWGAEIVSRAVVFRTCLERLCLELCLCTDLLSKEAYLVNREEHRVF